MQLGLYNFTRFGQLVQYNSKQGWEQKKPPKKTDAGTQSRIMRSLTTHYDISQLTAGPIATTCMSIDPDYMIHMHAIESLLLWQTSKPQPISVNDY